MQRHVTTWHHRPITRISAGLILACSIHIQLTARTDGSVLDAGSSAISPSPTPHLTRNMTTLHQANWRQRSLFNEEDGGEFTLSRPCYIEVLSSENRCQVKLNGRTVLLEDKRDRQIPPPGYTYSWRSHMNGMYAVTLNADTGETTGTAYAHDSTVAGSFFSVAELFSHTQSGRVLVLCVLAESAISLDQHGEQLMKAVGSRWAPDLQARSMFGLVAIKDVGVVSEGYSLNLAALLHGVASPTLKLTAHVPRHWTNPVVSCGHKGNQWTPTRQAFCKKHDGYRQLCDCKDPFPLRTSHTPFIDGSFFEYPVIILASNRPRYLFRCLSSLLKNKGVNSTNILVFIDGENEEVVELLQMLDISKHIYINDEDIKLSRGNIANNYRYAIETAFQKFPTTSKLVILEEDLEVSPDFLYYFHQTHHLLDIDPSLYCISAWNDHGYNHSVGDPTMLYRVGFLPGLGWMLTRSFFYEEMIPVWPPPWMAFDWDVMFRLPDFRKGRDCIIPDISRTYHFGFEGKHVGALMQLKYYYDHALNTEPDVKLSNVNNMVYHRYEGHLVELLKSGIPIKANGNNSKCSELVPRKRSTTPYILYIKMTSADDTAVWRKVASCLNLWDLDDRGQHRGIWRFFYNSNQVITVGVPYSDLSRIGIKGVDEATVFEARLSSSGKQKGRWPPSLQPFNMTQRAARFRLANAETELVDGGAT